MKILYGNMNNILNNKKYIQKNWNNNIVIRHKKKNRLEQMLYNLEKEAKQKKQTLLEHISVVCKLKNELNKIALSPDTFIESNYIDQMIKCEENEEKNQMLQKLKKK
eukprot:165002_1